MRWLGYIVILILLFTGVPALIRGEIWLGIAGILSPFLAIAAGGGITTAFRNPDYPSRTIAVLLGAALLAASIAWIWWMGWRIKIGPVEVPGPIENLIAFVVGLAFGQRERV